MRTIQRTLAGFTLIELMVVVGIIAFITGIIIPVVLSRLHESRDTRPKVELAQEPPNFEVVGGTRPPSIESTDITVQLRANQMLDGFHVATRYDAKFAGTFAIVNEDPAAGAVHVHFPFPPGMSEAKHVSLMIGDGEPSGVAYSANGIDWTGQVPPGGRAVVRIAYEASGRDAFVYKLAGEGRAGRVRCEVFLSSVERPIVPAASLQPSEAERGRLLWSFEQLITSRPIVVELPAGPSPLGRLILVLQLAAVAVLLFGAGIWYLSEGDKPGHLDTFRLGGLLLLALDYSLFFAAFAVIALEGPFLAGILVAGLIGQGLLLLHTSRIFSWRFSLSRVLPLSIFTLASVMVGAYLDAHRPLVFLTVVAAIAAYVTATYRGWSNKRTAHREAVQKKKARADREKAVLTSVRSLDEALSDAALADVEAKEALSAFGPGPEREALALASARLGAVIVASGAHQADVARLSSAPDEKSHHLLARRIEAVMGRQAAALQDATAGARSATAALNQKKDASRRTHCIACGAEGDADAKHCSACGVQRPKAQPCARCGIELSLPIHLFRRGAERLPLHCRGCGAQL